MERQKAHILVVEDEQKIRSALRDFLEFHGFGVTQAVDGLDHLRDVTLQPRGHRPEMTGVDPDAGGFHVGQDDEQPHFHVPEQALQVLFAQLRLEDLLEAERDVRVLARVSRSGRDVDFLETALFLA